MFLLLLSLLPLSCLRFNPINALSMQPSALPAFILHNSVLASRSDPCALLVCAQLHCICPPYRGLLCLCFVYAISAPCLPHWRPCCNFDVSPCQSAPMLKTASGCRRSDRIMLCLSVCVRNSISSASGRILRGRGKRWQCGSLIWTSGWLKWSTSQAKTPARRCTSFRYVQGTLIDGFVREVWFMGYKCSALTPKLQVQIPERPSWASLTNVQVTFHPKSILIYFPWRK